MKNHNLNLDSMSYQLPLRQAFSYADWKVLPEINRLEHQRSKTQTAIEPRLMHLLCFLAANEGSVVDRDTLIEQLWPKVVVNENSLTRAVSELRKHLRSESGSQQTVIETIPKKGYRLVAYRPETSPKGNSLPASIVEAGRAKNWAWSASKALTGAAFAASLAITAAILPMTDLDVDNTQVASAALSDEIVTGQPSYFGGKVTLSASELPSSEPATTRPVISHDGSSFAYLKYDNTGTTVFFGALSEMVDPMPIYHNDDVLLNLAWSPTGNSLLFARKPAMTTTALFSDQGQNLELLALNLATREVQRLVNDELDSDSEVLAEQNLT